MKSVAQRALALLILILVLVTLTGVAAAAKSLVSEGHANACCGQTIPADQQESSPCAAECSCSTCLTLLHPPVPQLQLPFALPRVGINALPNLHHSNFVSSIDYPPEIA